MYNKTYETVHTYVFTVGFTTAEQAVAILCEVKKIDSSASALPATSTGTMLNGKRVSKTIFQFIARPGAEKELFFKLKLKYAAFTLAKSLGHAVLTAYGPA